VQATVAPQIRDHQALDSHLSSVTDLVDEHLRQVLAREQRRWATVDPWLAEPVALLTDFVGRGGKRLRPAFCAYGYLAAGGHPDHAPWLDAAAGLELLHAFALLHDDVMDGSESRRGRPAMHRELDDVHRASEWRGESRRFGEGMAVLVGDLAFACADRLLKTARGDARQVWDELRLELVMGQYLDVAGAARGSVDRDRARRIARYKSGAYTVERPLHLGAAVAGWLPELSGPYSAFGRPLGEAFQFRDDLLGVFGDETATGKPVGDDLREGKPTLLLAIARERAGGAAAPLLDRIGAPDLSEHEIARLRRLLVDCGAREEVESLIDQRYGEAMSALDSAPILDRVRPALRALASQASFRER
jgi:geranylgeranyl diphosphate synthase, type I